MPDAGPYRVDRLENPCVWRMHGPTYSRYFDSESDARWEAFTLNNVYRAAIHRAQGVVEALRKARAQITPAADPLSALMVIASILDSALSDYDRSANG